ncbi:MAG: DUF2760 domain-containing protein [Candidatus Riflebacteria bacterium]|nr:DUF2760 domain-containing protein [Candidatus Riflebacteria bacterium]
MLKKFMALLTLAGSTIIISGTAAILHKAPSAKLLLFLIEINKINLTIGISLFFFAALFTSIASLLSMDEPCAKASVTLPAPPPQPMPVPAPETPKPEPKPEPKPVPSSDSGAPPAIALQILYLLQKEGRLLDFLMEDITPFQDEELGGAIRPIHADLKKILQDRLIIEHIIEAPEGETVDLGTSIDQHAIKLTGNVAPTGPYRGTLVHRGWRLRECKLPELVSGWEGRVIAPAEVEIA